MKQAMKRISKILILAIGISAVGSAQPAHAGKLEKAQMGIGIAIWVADKVHCASVLYDAKNGFLKPAKRYDCPLKNVKFDGQNLRAIEVTYQDMSGSSFVGTNLTGANLYGSLHENHNMEKANLTNANITYAEGISSLKDATLTGANVSLAQLSNTILDGVISGGIINTFDKYHQNLTLPSGWILTNGYLVGPKANIPNTADFTGGSFGGANLSTRLMPWNFTRAKFGSANLTNANLTGATLTGADLSQANLSGLVSANIVASPAASPSTPALTLPPGWVLNSGRLFGPSANLLNMDLTGLDLSALKPENLVNVTSSGIRGTAKALPAGYKVMDGQLVGPGVTIKNINLNNVDLSTMDLRGLTSSGVIGTPKALPTGWKLMNGFLIGPGANLNAVSGSGINFDGLNLRGTSVQGIHASGLTGSPLLDPGVKIVKGYLLGPGADLTGFDLSGADLSGVNLAGANVKGVKSGGITGAPDLGNAKYDGVPEYFGTSRDLDVSNWRYQNNPLGFYNGYLIGPGADLSGADLSGMTIPCGMDFRNTNLTNATLKNIYFESWRYSDSQKPGPHMDPRGFLKYFPFCIADFTGANFKGVKSGGNFGHKGWGDDGRNYSSPFNPSWPLCSWAAFNARVQEPSCRIRDDSHEIGSELGQVAGNLEGKTIAPKHKFLKGQIVGPGVDLRGLDFSGANLTGYDISNTNLSGLNIDNADLSSQSLTGVYTKGFLGTPKAIPAGLTLVGDYFLGRGADLTGIDLSNKDLRGMDLTGVNLTDANIAGAQFAGATLTNIVSKGVRGTPLSGMGVPGAPVNGTILYNGYVLTKGAVIGDADLSNANLEGVNLDGVDFSAVKLDGVRSGIIGTPSALSEQWDFYNGLFIGPGAKLNGYADKLVDADLTGDYLEGADFSGSNLSGVSASLIHGTPSALPEGWKQFGDILIGPGANLSNLSLAGLDLRRMDLTGVNLNSTNLEGTQMDFATKLTDVKQGNIFGTPASFPDNTKMINGYLVGPGVNLANANLGTADFTGVSLNGVSSGGVTGSFVHLPSNFSFIKGYFVGPGANLSNASFMGSKIDLKGLGYDSGSLSGLRGANITYDSGHNLPYCWTMFKIGGTGNTTIANLVGPSSDNTGMNFRNYDFSAWGSPTNASCFSQYDFTNADLYGAKSNGKIVSVRGLPAGWRLINGWLVGPGANLTGANLSKAQLKFVDLTNVNLTGANLAGAYTCALSTKGVIPPAGWKVINNCLVGPGANLSNADLTGANLQSMNLSNTKFDNANLTDAVITGANLSGVNFYTTNLTRVKSGSITQGPSQLPPGYWAKVNGYLVGPTANLEGANFSGLNLSGNSYWDSTNLRGADFSRSTLSASMSGVDATNAKFVGTKFTAWLQGAKLVNADFTNATITVSLCGNDLTGAKFTGTVSTVEIVAPFNCYVRNGNYNTAVNDATVVLPDGVKILAGTFVGGGANLKNANLAGGDFTNASFRSYDFSGANLTGANFSGSDLDMANFSGANLTGVKSGGIRICALPTLPLQWTFNAGYLIGPKADLSNADLRSMDLSNATLTGVKSGNIRSGNTTMPTGYKLVNGFIVGRGVDLTGADLSGANLQGMNLTGAILTGVNLTGTKLIGAVLTGVIGKNVIGTPESLSSGITISNGAIIGPGVDLTGADLTGVNLAKVNLTGAILSGVYSGKGAIKGTPAALPTGWKLIKGYLVGPGADLGARNNDTSIACRWFGACDPNLAAHTDLSGADLTGVDLTGARLIGATLTGANFTNATLTGADLSDADITDSIFDGAKLKKNGSLTNLGCKPGQWWCSARSAGVSFAGADISDVNFSRSNLSGVNFSGSTLTDVNLTDSYLATANFKNATLLRVNLTDCNLENADFTNAVLGNVTLTRGTLKGATLTSADLSSATLDSVIALNVTGTVKALPTGWQQFGKNIVGPGAVLTGANLATLNLSGATLTGVKSGSVTGTPTLPTNWKLIGGYLVGPGADLSGANLSTLNLSAATLTGVTSGSVTGTPTLPTGWVLVDGYLLGTGITVAPPHWEGNTYVQGVCFNGTEDLSGVSLSGSRIFISQAYGCKSPSALPTDWKVLNGGLLIGPGANMRNFNQYLGGNFGGAVLRDVDFTGVNFGSTDFTGANFAGADFGGAIFWSYADIRGTDISGTPKSLPPGWSLVDGELVGPSR